MFADNGIDAVLLAELTNDDLKDIGVVNLRIVKSFSRRSQIFLTLNPPQKLAPLHPSSQRATAVR